MCRLAAALAILPVLAIVMKDSSSLFKLATPLNYKINSNGTTDYLANSLLPHF